MRWIKPRSSLPLNIAHRGARSLAPENTLAAAAQALRSGADMWELDVGVTADGELVVIHDGSLERTSNVRRVYPDRSPWFVHDFTLGELRRLDFGSWFIQRDPFEQIAGGAVSQPEWMSYRGERIPTLREALMFTAEHDWSVNVEIKDLSGTPGDEYVVEKTVALVEETRMTGRVLVSSFNHGYLERVKAANSQMAVGALVSRPMKNPAALLQRLKAEAYHPRMSAMRLDEIEKLQARGFAVCVWVVNDEKTMRTLIDAKVDAIFTDFPQKLTPILAAYQQRGM